MESHRSIVFNGQCRGPGANADRLLLSSTVARGITVGLTLAFCFGTTACHQAAVPKPGQSVAVKTTHCRTPGLAKLSKAAVLRGPLHAFAWSKTPKDAANITPMIWISRPNRSLAAAARASRQAPAGDAAVFIWRLHGVYHHFLKDQRDAARRPNGKLTRYVSPWVSHGTSRLKRAALRCFRRYKNDGGRMDYLILDFEGGYGISNWQLTPAAIRAIRRDPRSKALARQLGFGDFASIEQYTTSNHYLIWNALMKQAVDTGLNNSVFAAARQYYPDVKASNYSDYIMTRRNSVWAPSGSGHPNYQHSYFGTACSMQLYGCYNQLAQQQLGKGGKPYGREPFAVLRWEVNRIRAACRSSDLPELPWIAAKNFGHSDYYGLRHSIYYNELIYHVALSGVADFLLFDPRPWLKTQNPAHWANNAQDMLVNRLLARLNEKFGNQPRRAVTLAPVAWNSSLIATGMQIGEHEVLWRVTVPPTVRRVRVAEAGSVRMIDLAAGKVGFWYKSRPGRWVRFTVAGTGLH